MLKQVQHDGSVRWARADSRTSWGRAASRPRPNKGGQAFRPALIHHLSVRGDCTSTLGFESQDTYLQVFHCAISGRVAAVFGRGLLPQKERRPHSHGTRRRQPLGQVQGAGRKEAAKSSTNKATESFAPVVPRGFPHGDGLGSATWPLPKNVKCVHVLFRFVKRAIPRPAHMPRQNMASMEQHKLRLWLRSSEDSTESPPRINVSPLLIR